ncbi:MAG: 50S ribosomal protein L30 [Clostridiaceae bacterium]|nr:50S ribosomal protein L30 [Clostridiaceae bacterium]
MSRLKITLKRSLAGCNKKQLATLQALGLSKIGQTVEKEDNAPTKGMIHLVEHLVEVEQA